MTRDASLEEVQGPRATCHVEVCAGQDGWVSFWTISCSKASAYLRQERSGFQVRPNYRLMLMVLDERALVHRKIRSGPRLSISNGRKMFGYSGRL